MKKFTSNIPSYHLGWENDENSFVYAMGFVEYPAIEVDFTYFNNNKCNYTFAKQVEENEQRLIIGPAMVPDKNIYRFDFVTGEEYYVYFTPEDIRKFSQDFLISNNQLNVTEQHINPLKGVNLVYTWIVENDQDQAMTKYGFKLPVGTWMTGYKINNDDIWNKIKTGEIKGLSIEGMFTEMADMSLNKRYDKFKNIINQDIVDINELKKMLKI
jgi:hypothetical protein